MEKIKEARLSAKGQITIPIAVRERLGVKNGDPVAFYMEGDSVKLTSVNNLEIKPKKQKKVATITKGEKENGQN